MLLYTPLSEEEAAEAAKGLGFPDDDLYFVDHPDPDEAQNDAVWVVIEISEDEALSYEERSDPPMDYREFRIPGGGRRPLPG
jgi:hypothetical protein